NTKALLKTALLKDMMNGMLYVQNDRNMMHLDLKPGNYLINDDGKAVVSDFGSSKRDQSGFNTSNLEATVVYRSPEVVSKDRNADDKLVITEKSDIWTMGVVLHDVFYGPNRLEGKFSADTENNIYQFSKNENNKLIENEVTPVDTLINSMAHPNPEKRPTFEAILQSSVFSDNKLDKPELKQLVLELLKPNPDTNKVKELEGLINQ
ncbi:MAG: protein kinase domain-containing protein, partial [Candidatus Sericytochromatia bacterium]